MGRDCVKQARHKLNAKEKLRLPIQTPWQKVYERHESIGLNHVVAVLSQTAELGEDLDDQVDYFGKGS